MLHPEPKVLKRFSAVDKLESRKDDGNGGGIRENRHNVRTVESCEKTVTITATVEGEMSS